MSETKIEFIHSARRLTGREEFHRHLFESMLGGLWRRQVVALPPEEEAALLAVLSRWIQEAPAKDELGVLRLLAVRGVVRSLVAATSTSFRSFLLGALASSEQELLQPQRMPAWKQAKLAALADASLLSVEALSGWIAQDPVNARLAAIACLDACPLDPNVAANTEQIGRWLVSLPPAKLPLRYLEQLQTSAFFVSYLASPDRHDFKRALVRQAAFMLPGLRPQSSSPGGAGRGSAVRLTIVGELLFPQHAMFRCYAELLAGLKDHFHVTLVTDAPTRCAEHGQFSHEQSYFPPQERDVARLADLVAATRPDIILYPSIGMSYWTFALSLMRLAPLQLMSVGHPAPSCSGQIDGTLVYRDLAAAPLPQYGELISYESQDLPAPPPEGWHAQPAAASADPVIAINAARMKLTPQFLALVESALASAPPGTQVHFFPNATGVELLALRRALHAQFPAAEVHAATNYARYMEALSKAAVILQSFPFGGTNTAMDALALGIPLVCLEGEDLASRVDTLLLRRAGLPELCASSVSEYLAITGRLLNSAEERAQLKARAKAGLVTLAAQAPLGPLTMAEAILRAWQSRAAAD